MGCQARNFVRGEQSWSQAPFPRDFGVAAKGGGVLFAAADTFNGIGIGIGIGYHRRKGEGEDHCGNGNGREVNPAR